MQSVNDDDMHNKNDNFTLLSDEIHAILIAEMNK